MIDDHDQNFWETMRLFIRTLGVMVYIHLENYKLKILHHLVKNQP